MIQGGNLRSPNLSDFHTVERLADEADLVVAGIAYFVNDSGFKVIDLHNLDFIAYYTINQKHEFIL